MHNVDLPLSLHPPAPSTDDFGSLSRRVVLPSSQSREGQRISKTSQNSNLLASEEGYVPARLRHRFASVGIG